MTVMSTRAEETEVPEPAVGGLLRDWRQRRRLSQLELGSRTEVSTRHLSCIETGRSRPTPEMILRLAEELDVPLGERNRLLLAGGFAPRFSQGTVEDQSLEVVMSGLPTCSTPTCPGPLCCSTTSGTWWTATKRSASCWPAASRRCSIRRSTR